MLDNFTQMNMINKKNIRDNNSIWHIANLFLPSSSYRYEKIQTSKREAIIIYIDKSPEFNISEQLDLTGYILNNRHLSIDKKYKTTNVQHGLYLAHYTEEHIHENDGSSIKLHVYLNKHAQCIYVQAKKYCFNPIKEKFIIKLPSESVAAINSQDAIAILKKLLIMRVDSYMVYVKESNSLEEQLCDAFVQCINGKINFESYEKKAMQFIEVVKKINIQVDDYIDMRGEIVKIILKNLYSKMQKSETNSKIEYNQTEFEDDIVKLTFIHTKDELSDNGKQKSQLMLELKNNYSKLNTSVNILEQYKISQDIKQCLLILYFNQQFTKLLSKEEQVFIDKIEKEVYFANSLSDQLFEFFVERCFSGDFDMMKKTFYYIKHKINLKFIYDLVQVALSAPRGEKLNSIVDIMNFLHDNSEIYKTIFPELSNTICSSKFINNVPRVSSDSIVELNKIKIPFETIKIADQSKIKVWFSPLCKAIYTNNMLLFKTLLAHGLVANSFGIIECISSKPFKNPMAPGLVVVPNARACCYFNSDLDFIKTLYDNSSSVFCYESCLSTFNVKNGKFSIDFSQECGEFTAMIMEEHFNQCPILSFVGSDNDLSKEHVEFFEQNFLNKANFIDLMVSLMSLLHRGYHGFAFAFRGDFSQDNLNKKILFYETPEAGINSIKEQEGTCKKNTIKFVFCDPKLGFPYVRKMIEIIYQHLMKILKQQPIEIYIKIMLLIGSKLEDSIDRSLLEFKANYLEATLLLLSFKEKLTQSELSDVIRLLSNISKLLKNKNTSESEKRKMMINCIINKIKTDKLIEEKSRDLPILQFSKPNIQPYHTCAPPPGSVVKDGKTIVSLQFLS